MRPLIEKDIAETERWYSAAGGETPPLQGLTEVVTHINSPENRTLTICL